MLLAPADNVSVALELLNRATSKLQRLQVLSDHLPITVNHNLEEVDSERQKFTKLFKGKRYAKVVGLDANVELLGGQTAPRRRRRRRRNRSNFSRLVSCRSRRDQRERSDGSGAPARSSRYPPPASLQAACGAAMCLARTATKSWTTSSWRSEPWGASRGAAPRATGHGRPSTWRWRSS